MNYYFHFYKMDGDNSVVHDMIEWADGIEDKTFALVGVTGIVNMRRVGVYFEHEIDAVTFKLKFGL